MTLFAPGPFVEGRQHAARGGAFPVWEAVDREVERFVYRCEPEAAAVFLEHLEQVAPEAPTDVERHTGGFAARFGQRSPTLALFGAATLACVAAEALTLVLVAAGAWDLLGLAGVLLVGAAICGSVAWGRWRDQWRWVELDGGGLVVRSARLHALGLDSGERFPWSAPHTAVLRQVWIRGEPAWHFGFEHPGEAPRWALTTEVQETPAPLLWLAGEVRAHMALHQGREDGRA